MSIKRPRSSSLSSQQDQDVIHRKCNSDTAPQSQGMSEKLPHPVFFLSHFHSDHYNGINPGWSHGIINASRATANLLRWKLGVSSARVRCMDFGMTYIFSIQSGMLLSVESGRAACVEDCFAVELIPANHCPGAVMFLFRSAAFGTVLHTGDFRFSPPSPLTTTVRLPSWEPDLREDPVLKTLGTVDVLFFDNTYCFPQFKFPARAEVLKWINTEVFNTFLRCKENKRASVALGEGGDPHKRNQRVSVAVLIGSYFIGKELIALSIQENFPPKDVFDGATLFAPTYVPPEKYEALQKLDYHPDHFKPFSSLEQTETCSDDKDCATNCLDEYITGFTPREITLPSNSEASQGGDARNETFSSITSADPTGADAVTYCLTTFMVPMAAVLYGTLASACGHPRRRKGDDLDEDKSLGIAREVLPIGKKKFLDLKQFDCVLCINPTGWTGKPSKQKISDRVVSFKVPYSEHCSFSELIDFVSFVNPRVVIPTVSLKAFQQHESLFVEKAPQLRSRYSNVQPLMPFLTKVPKLSESRMSVMAGAADATAKTEKQRNPFARTKDTTLTLTHSLNSSERERRGEVPGPRGLSQSGWSGSTRIHQETRDHHTAKENIRKINGIRSVNRITVRSSPRCSSKPNSVEQPIRPDDVVTEKLSAAGTTTESSSWSPGNEDDDCFVVKINGPVIDISDSSE